MKRFVLVPMCAFAAAISACATVPPAAPALSVAETLTPVTTAVKKLPAVPPRPEGWVDPVDFVRLARVAPRARPEKPTLVAEAPKANIEAPVAADRFADVRPRPRIVLASAETAPLEGLSAQGGPEVPLPLNLRRFETLH